MARIGRPNSLEIDETAHLRDRSMTDVGTDEPGYTDAFIGSLELRWGEGFLSPGGAEEVARILHGVDLRDREVLDFGCGPGGVDHLLIREHGAGHVLGVDIGRPAIDRAKDRAAASGLADRLSYILVESGPLPLADASFDVVFSKDAIMHVANKRELYAEMLRVLRPGGRLVIGDWYRGDFPYSAEMNAYVESANFTLALETLEETARALRTAGFGDIGTCDRAVWYGALVQEELAQATGPDRARLVGLLGKEGAARWVERMRVKAAAVENGDLRPGHLRASKPAANS